MIELTATDAEELLRGITADPWLVDNYYVIPMRSCSEGWLIADCGTSNSPDSAESNVEIIAAAPDLARAVIRLEAERDAALNKLNETQTQLYFVSVDRDKLRSALAELVGDSWKIRNKLKEIQIEIEILQDTNERIGKRLNKLDL